MQNDEVTWDLLSNYHCSYKAKIETGKFCRNPDNVTGICNRISCPLANSRYATIRDLDGVFYLYMKTIERAHMPKDLWEMIKLPRNYDKALETIDKHLLYWPKSLQHKVKQRLTKMNQMLIRMRRLALKTREKIMTTPRREIKIEARREEKAEKAAELDKVIEKELGDRLRIGIYGNIYDDKVLAEDAEEEEEEETEIEFVDGYEELEEDEEDMEDFFGFPSNEPGFDNDDEHDSADEEDDSVVIHKKGRRDSRKRDDHGKAKKKARVVVEVELEDENVRRILKTVIS